MGKISLNTKAMIKRSNLDINPNCSLHTLQEHLREVMGISVYCIPSVLSSRPNSWVWIIETINNGVVSQRQQTDDIFNGYNESLDKGLYEAMKSIN